MADPLLLWIGSISYSLQIFYDFSGYSERTLNCEVDPAVEDPSNYRTETYEAWHLGSRGQRTGAYFSGIDDFELILPEFGTSLERGDIGGGHRNL